MKYSVFTDKEIRSKKYMSIMDLISELAETVEISRDDYDWLCRSLFDMVIAKDEILAYGVSPDMSSYLEHEMHEVVLTNGDSFRHVAYI